MGTDGWMGGWIFQWTHGWVDGCVNERMARRMDGAHKIPEAFCSSLSSELSYSSCLFPEPSNRRLNFQVCLMWGWAAGMDRYGCVSSLPPAVLGNRDPCPLERALTRPVRQPPGPPAELTQNKAWAVSVEPPHPLNWAYIYVTLQDWWRPDVTKQWFGQPWNAEIPSWTIFMAAHIQQPLLKS